MAGANQRKGYARPDISTYGRVWAVPLQRKLRGEALQESNCLSAQEPISGGNKGYKVSTEMSTGAGVFVLLGYLAGAKGGLG